MSSGEGRSSRDTWPRSQTPVVPTPALPASPAPLLPPPPPPPQVQGLQAEYKRVTADPPAATAKDGGATAAAASGGAAAALAAEEAAALRKTVDRLIVEKQELQVGWGVVGWGRGEGGPAVQGWSRALEGRGHMVVERVVCDEWCKWRYALPTRTPRAAVSSIMGGWRRDCGAGAGRAAGNRLTSCLLAAWRPSMRAPCAELHSSRLVHRTRPRPTARRGQPQAPQAAASQHVGPQACASHWAAWPAPLPPGVHTRLNPADVVPRAQCQSLRVGALAPRSAVPRTRPLARRLFACPPRMP